MARPTLGNEPQVVDRSPNISRTCRSRTRARRRSSSGRCSRSSTSSSTSTSTRSPTTSTKSCSRSRSRRGPSKGVHFLVDLSYGGLFGLRNVPEEALPPFLLIEAPRLLFPFARQIVAEAVSERRLPAAAARPDRFRRRLHGAAPGRAGAAGAKRPAGELASADAGRPSPPMTPGATEPFGARPR